MNDDLGKLIAFSLHATATMDQMVTIGICYQKKQISIEVFAEKMMEFLVAYQTGW